MNPALRRLRGAASTIVTAAAVASVATPVAAFAAVPADTALAVTPAAEQVATPAPEAPTCARPTQGPLTSGFGARWGRMHEGEDFGAPYGAPIHAFKHGMVTYAGPMAGYGTLVVIAHSDGTQTAYGHSSKIIVHQGQEVQTGQVIAYVGSEGHSTGPHLHFEVRTGAVKHDPLPYLENCGEDLHL